MCVCLYSPTPTTWFMLARAHDFMADNESLLCILKIFAQCPCSLHSTRKVWCFRSVCSSRIICRFHQLHSSSSPRSTPETPSPRVSSHGMPSIYCIYTGCNRRNGANFGRLFLMLNYTEKPQNTYIQSWTVSEIMASEVWNFDSCYTLITKFILKLAGICGFCNVNICTFHQSNLWVT